MSTRTVFNDDKINQMKFKKNVRFVWKEQVTYIIEPVGLIESVRKDIFLISKTDFKFFGRMEIWEERRLTGVATLNRPINKRF